MCCGLQVLNSGLFSPSEFTVKESTVYVIVPVVDLISNQQEVTPSKDVTVV